MILLMREDCHLCDDAKALLHALAVTPVQLVDIDSSPELGARYGLRIPVLADAQGRELEWPFGQAELAVWLHEVAATP